MIDDIKKQAEGRMKKSVEALRKEFSKMRTGRAHTGLLDHIHVTYYGTELPLNQVANISVEDARTLAVQPWEKSMVPVIEKAIIASDMGLNPATAGQVIRVPVPPLTEERRKDMIRVVRQEAEGARVAIRSIRRDAIQESKGLVKNKSISEDDDKRLQDAIQKLTDTHVGEVDKMLESKEADLMQV